MKSAAFYILPAILLVAIIACNDADDMIIDEDLLDVVWKVDSLQHLDTCVVIDSLEQMTIQFTSDEQIKGGPGCRGIEGRYLIRKAGNISIDNLIIDSTLKNCGKRLEFLAAALYLTLEHITRYDVTENRLNLYDSDCLYIICLRGE